MRMATRNATSDSRAGFARKALVRVKPKKNRIKTLLAMPSNSAVVDRWQAELNRNFSGTSKASASSR